MASDPSTVFGPVEVGGALSDINNEADIVVLANGDSVVVWTARLPGRDVVHMQRFDAAGQALGAALELGDGSKAQIELLADGGYAVAWSTGFDLVGLRFDAAGNDVTGSVEYTNLPSIEDLEVEEGSGVIFVPGTGTIERFGTEVFGRNVLGPNDLPDVLGNVAFDGFSLTALTGGGYVLTGSYYRGADAGFDMFAMVYGATPGDLVPVAVRLPDDLHPAPGDQVNQQRVLATAALENGGFVLVWRNDDVTGAASTQLRMQRFDATGTADGAAFTVAESPEGLFDPVVTSLRDGGYVVAWSGSANNPDTGDFGNVVFRIYNADGSTRQISTVPHPLPGLQLNPAVVALESGGFIVTWSQFFSTTGDWEVFGRGYTADGVVIPAFLSSGIFPLGLSRGLSYVDTAIAATADDDLRLVWTEQALNRLNDERLFNNVEFTGFDALVPARDLPTTGPDVLNGTPGRDTIGGLTGDDSISGLADDDLLTGDEGDDTLEGGDGNDRLFGNDGNDRIFGGANFDTIIAGEGNDTVNGGNGRDLVFLNQGDDFYIDNGQGGELGRDTVFAGYGNDTIEGGNGDDEFHGEWGDDIIAGRLGSDEIWGGDGNDSLSGGDGNDEISGGDGNDLIFGGAGLDIIVAGAGNDTVFGGDGEDTVRLGDGDDLFNDTSEDGPRGRDSVTAGDGNDTIEGGGGIDDFRGEGGDDLIRGRLGNDLLVGGAGNDTLDGGEGNDGIFGNLGNDLILTGNALSGPAVFGGDVVFGGAGDDTVEAGNGNDELHGEDGNDSINGGLGNDMIFGGANFDTISAGEGNDTVFGGDGRDLVYLNQGDDLFNDNGQGGELGRDTVFAGFGDDTIQGGNGNDVFHGEWGNDVIFARLGNDVVYGGDNFDFIDAGEGNDTVYGGNGQDTVMLGAGDDTFIDTDQTGDLGRDTITGGFGADTFVFGRIISIETITDFQVGVDRLELHEVLTGGRTAAQVAEDGLVRAEGVLLSFTTGQSLLLEGLTSTAGLGDDISIIF